MKDDGDEGKQHEQLNDFSQPCINLASISLFITSVVPSSRTGSRKQFYSPSAMLTIFSPGSFLQESALNPSALSVSLPTSSCPTSLTWRYTHHSLLNYLCLPSIVHHIPKLSEHSFPKPASSYGKNPYCFQESSTFLLPTWSSVIASAGVKPQTSCLASTAQAAALNTVTSFSCFLFFMFITWHKYLRLGWDFERI